MLRFRDIVAVFAAFCLVRMAWNNEQESVFASMHLAFYTNGASHSVAPFDLDGDGTVEALAVVTPNEDRSRWEVQVLDLKPLHRQRTTVSMAPFRPKAILSSTPILTNTEPLKITTGQIIISKSEMQKVEVKLDEHKTQDITHISRHYFCGVDWHDAAKRCATPCPGGLPSECPGGERCYADTPCDALQDTKPQLTEEEIENAHLHLTPAGGIPCVVSLWGDGVIRMHALKTGEGDTNLQLREMWNHEVVLGFDEYDVLILGSEDISGTSSDLGKNGVVVVAGTQGHHSMVVTLDSLSGQELWNTRNDSPTTKEELGAAIQPSERGQESYARRRSRILSADESIEEVAMPNCWVLYRHSLLEEAMPFAYWGPGDRKWMATHLDRTPRRSNKPHSSGKHNRANRKLATHKRRRHHHRHAEPGPIHGRPNVLLSHTRNGIQVRSLKNGRPICHLSLLDRVLYADLNNDGTLDQLQIVTSHVPESHNKKWITSLAEQISAEKQELSEKNVIHGLKASSRLCHALALSGLPAREEMFSASLCGGAFARDRGDHMTIDLHSAPPLVVDGTDVVLALSNGMVNRFHVGSGQKIWQLRGQSTNENFPTWGAFGDAALTASLGVAKASHLARPILVAGENGMALLSASHGFILASTVFPQVSRSRPILVDLSGDGTEDVIIATQGALWGYQIVLTTGASALFRIMVGLLLMGIALAVLRNRYNGEEGDRRSTDA